MRAFRNLSVSIGAVPACNKGTVEPDVKLVLYKTFQATTEWRSWKINVFIPESVADNHTKAYVVLKQSPESYFEI